MHHGGESQRQFLYIRSSGPGNKARSPRTLSTTVFSNSPGVFVLLASLIIKIRIQVWLANCLAKRKFDQPCIDLDAIID